ncbi:MAG: hypothetical protein B6244_05175 [Candidatus Cloacimonetes bacterium 4572_55]|nr:MAG: hypothetical protein B6244_05175 [Candidatus Cloacimonetes bacterium 4572_55]
MHYRILSDCLITPKHVMDRATVEICGRRIKAVHDQFVEDREIPTLDARGKLVAPAFINAHDHFLGTWTPRVGRGHYFHWAHWNADLKSSDVTQDRSKTSDLDRYIMASYKSICAGVTTASDHIPHEINDPFVERMPIRILTDYTLAHAVSDMRLDWGNGIQIEYEQSEGKKPFITHCNEGFDADSKDEVYELHRLGVLQRNTVLIHGVALNDDDIRLMAQQEASLVWCPVSNMFMYNVTADVPRLQKAGVNVALGTDSCATGGLHLMAELQYAKEVAASWDYGEISDRDYLNMVTINAAKALMIHDKLGSVEAGKLADLLVLERKAKDPYAAATDCLPADIRLLTMSGKPLLGEPGFQNLFDQSKETYSTVAIQGQRRLIIGEPMKVVERVRHAVGSHKELPFLPFA